ncbi:putative membrane protein [Piscirickettsia salmonis LF-89 = ATCC VR-1361]|nr:putative membrane protein [Piscirickettsia salmonis LF-89 = ATCC VR-1361]
MSFLSTLTPQVKARANIYFLSLLFLFYIKMLHCAAFFYVFFCV